MTVSRLLLDNIAIVLKAPKYAENIGAAARSCFNMGLSRLVLVREEYPDHEAMAKMATHNAIHIIDNMEVHTQLADAIAPFSFVIGTTARLGRKRTTERSPREVVANTLPLLKNNKVALLFGPEDRGLTNDDLKYCQFTSSIATADFSSLNLAQAVAIHCYEFYYAIAEQTRENGALPEYATTHQLEQMYCHVEDALLAIDFLDHKSHKYWMRNIRQFLGKIRLSAKEANIVRGICRKFLWFQNKRSLEVHKELEK